MGDKGYVHVYTGNGKGKTTAAFGLAVRALCAGKKVYVGQFVKSMAYSETKLTEFFSGLVIEQLGHGCFIYEQATAEDIKAALAGLKRCEEVLQSNQYDVVILDELTIALYFKLFSVFTVLDILDARPPQIEVIITGRYAPKELLDYADLVTEMQEVKHYYTQGVLSRKGIDK